MRSEVHDRPERGEPLQRSDHAGRGIQLIAGHTRNEYRLFLPAEPGGGDERTASRALAVYGPGP